MTQSTHSDQCWRWHPDCADRYAADNTRVRAALGEVLAEFTAATQFPDGAEAFRTPWLPASRVDGWHRALEPQPPAPAGPGRYQRPHRIGEETT